MAMIADGNLDNREIEALDSYRIPQAVGMPRDAFVQVVLDYCRDLLATAQSQTVRLFEPSRINFILDQVQEHGLRLTACSAILVLGKADGRLSTPEQTLLRHVLERWQITLEQIADHARGSGIGAAG